MNPLQKLFMSRRKAYRQLFQGPHADVVLADLRRFCRATMPTADVDNEKSTYLLEGRREVWLRIANFLNLSDDQIYQLMEKHDE